MKNKRYKLITLFLFCIGLLGLQAQTFKDIEGNVYNSIIIGKQTWMKENLKVTKYNDGKAIPLVAGTQAWEDLTTDAYCNYANNESFVVLYGRLYNWYAASNKNICPTGWHVPTDVEFTTLVNYLGGDSIAGGNMKEAGSSNWSAPNTGANNSSSFTALPGGTRYADGTFHYIGEYGYWWSSTENSITNVWHITIYKDAIKVGRYSDHKGIGLSIRCLKN